MYALTRRLFQQCHISNSNTPGGGDAQFGQTNRRPIGSSSISRGGGTLDKATTPNRLQEHQPPLHRVPPPHHHVQSLGPHHSHGASTVSSPPQSYHDTIHRYIASLRFHHKQSSNKVAAALKNKGGHDQLLTSEEQRARLNASRRRGTHAARIFVPLFLTLYFLMDDWVTTVQARQARMVIRESRVESSRRREIDISRW